MARRNQDSLLSLYPAWIADNKTTIAWLKDEITVKGRTYDEFSAYLGLPTLSPAEKQAKIAGCEARSASYERRLKAAE